MTVCNQSNALMYRSNISNENHQARSFRQRKILDITYKRVGLITDGVPECSVYTQYRKQCHVPKVDSEQGEKIDEANSSRGLVC